MRTDRQPGFIVIGAVKAATTWIAHQLRQHPDLWLPDAEPHYFSREFHRGPEWYQSLFAAAPAGRAVGEKSADYLAHPEAPARIAAALPDVRLVAQLRDPVSRAYSDYCMLFRRGMVGPDPSRYLVRPDAGHERFMEGGFYAAHIERYLRHFRRDQLKIFLHEDIRDRPKEVITEVLDHIGARLHIAPDAVRDRRNDSQAEMLPLFMRLALKPLRPILDPLRANQTCSRLRAAIARPVRYPPLSAELRALLRGLYRDDILRLEDILRRDLSSWLADCPQSSAIPDKGARQHDTRPGRPCGKRQPPGAEAVPIQQGET